MKQLSLFQRGVAAFLAIPMALSGIPFPAAARTVPVSSSSFIGEIALDPQVHYQTLEGWGTSLCWWGNIIGSAGDRDTNGNGRPDREEIAELVFSPEYLNLNIVRYNVGGGDKPDTSIKRVEGLVPGWSRDMFGTDDGTGTFKEEEFYSKESGQMKDAGQIWMLEQANQWRVSNGDIINKVFSNSPPYYMTKSGSSTGGYEWDKENLRDDSYDDFATYLVRATKWLDQDLKSKYGKGVDYVEPFNEPDTNYWINGSTKQEGCIFRPGTNQIKAYQEVKKALEQEHLSDVKLTGTDETALWNAINSFEKLDAQTRKDMAVISAHTYGGSDSEREQLRKLAASYDKGLWMSEVTKGGDTHGEGTHDSMWAVNAKDQSEGIMADIKKMKVSAWIMWLAADSEYECIQTNSSWGPIHYVFEDHGPVKGYHSNLFDSNGNVKEDVPKAGYFALTKQFYTMMQYSKFLKSGYTMVEIGDGNMCAAISPNKQVLVIVAQNFTSGTRDTSVDLNMLPNGSDVKLYRTSDSENCRLIQDGTLERRVLPVSLPGNSVSTYVITSKDGKALLDSNGYKKIVECDIQTTDDTALSGASDLNKFSYSGDWKDGWNIQEKYTTQKDSSASFRFTGTQAAIYGKKSPNGANLMVTVDGGEPTNINTNSPSVMRRSLLYMSPALGEGDHTVFITMADSQTAATPEIVLEYAEIINGELAMKTPRITNIAAHDGKLIVEFQGVDGVVDYTVECGTSLENMTVSGSAQNGVAVLSGLINGTDYLVRVRGNDGSGSNVESGRPSAVEEGLCYFVNAGTGQPRVLKSGQSFGCDNGILDQAYGADIVTGKIWGYTNDMAYGHTGEDWSEWDSLRYDGRDAAEKGLEYRFQLEKGGYTVEVGMDDPWNNSKRSQDLILQGEKVETLVPYDQTVKIYNAVVKEDGLLTIKAVRSKGNTDPQCDPLMNWIKIRKITNDSLVDIEKLQGFVTVRGVVPDLPRTVTGITPDGDTVEREVEWKVSSGSFDAKEYTGVTIKGNVDGYALGVSADVLVVPQNLQYFIDCNNQESDTYIKLKSHLALFNGSADQKYSDGSWGYAEDYGSHPSGITDKYENGWYAYKNQDIVYKMPLEAGSYTVDFGFQEWWGQTRPMKISASYITADGNTVTKELGTVTVAEGNPEAVVSASFDLPETGEVEFKVSKNGGIDPVLSFFDVHQKIDHAPLISALGQAHTLNRTGCDARLLEALDTAVLAGFKQLTAPETTKAGSDSAAKAVTDALTALVNGKEFTEEELAANDYILYLVNCGTPDPSVVPTEYKLGLMQSVVDQMYGKDPVKKNLWGYAEGDAYSAMDKNGSDAADITGTCVSMSPDVIFDREKSGLKYSFALPAGDYQVTAGFMNPWSDRDVDVKLEGRTAGASANLQQETLIEKQYTVEVTDGELNVMVHSPKRTNQYGDPILSYLIVKAVPEYGMNMLRNTLAKMDETADQAEKGRNWTDKSLAAFRIAREKAEILIEAGTEDREEIRNMYFSLYEAFAGLVSRREYDSITGAEGAPYYDTNGVQIQAHGGQIQQITVDGKTKYYWIGEDKTYDYRPVGGIHLYTSEDLYNWKDEGVVLRTMERMDEFETDPYFNEVYGDYSQEKKKEVFIDLDKNNCVIERPKMIYNEKTDKYVIWFHADGRTPWNDADYGKAKAGVAIADTPEGPYKLLGSYDLNYVRSDNQGFDGNHLGAVRDMNLFVDDDKDKTAYVIYSSQGNQTLFISRLNEEYTGLVVPKDNGVQGEHFTTNFKGWSREAPSMFKYNKKYYMINSGCTGWSPNEAKYAVADHPLGPWIDMGDPCEGANSNKTFYTQSTCVFPVDAESGKYIYMGDRWNADDLSESRYVWLPVEFQDGNRLVLRPYSNWTLEELDNKGLAYITTEIPEQFASLAELEDALPGMVDVKSGNETWIDAPVKWDDIDENRPFVGDYTVYGTLEEQGRRISHTATILNRNTRWFFDCGADSSEYFDLMKDQAPGLLNMEPDQAYTEENHAGYMGTEGTSFGRYSGHDLYGNGWWAEKDQSIEYAFNLSPGEYIVYTGYQEWWNTKRGIRISAGKKNEAGTEEKLASKDFTLEQYDRNLVQELKFTVPGGDDTSLVFVRVEKTGSADPVLSFISLVPEKAAETYYTISGIVTEKKNGVADLDVNLYKGGDITIASPSEAAKTGEDGAYAFKNLKDGIYCIEVPDQVGYEQAVKVIEVNGKNVTDADLELTRKEEPEREEEIRIKTLPVRRNYLMGDQLDPEGLQVALYREGEEERVLEKEEYTLSELDSSTSGKKKITVTYVEEEGNEQKTLKAFFEVIVYQADSAPEIKVVRKPDKLFYISGEDLDLSGMEVRGQNLLEAGVTILEAGDYEAEYDFSEPGISTVTVTYTLEKDGEPATVLKDSFQVTVFEAEESERYVEEIHIVQKPYRIIYRPGDDFDVEGMTVEKTIKMVASSSNATYKEVVPLEDLEVEPDDYSKTGKKRVRIFYYADGENGEEKEFSDTLNVTITRNETALTEGDLEALKRKLEDRLLYGEYLTEAEKRMAFTEALDEAAEIMQNVEEREKLSDKTLKLLKDLEEKLLKQFDHITVSLQADSFFKNVRAEGLGLNAGLEPKGAQMIRLQIRRAVEEVPDEIVNLAEKYVAMDIVLSGAEDEMQPRLPIRITMDIPEVLGGEKLVIYYYHDGDIHVIHPIVRGNKMSFDVWELSMFVAVNTKDDVNPAVPGKNGVGDGDADHGPGFTVPGEWKKCDIGWWYEKKSGGYIFGDWARINGLWYNFDERGYMRTGWIFDKGNWYYLNEDGSMAAGKWILCKQKWYYLTWKGTMAVNTLTPDGYTVGSDGAWEVPGVIQKAN